jgi:mono/diheme cytochrome c family protein
MARRHPLTGRANSGIRLACAAALGGAIALGACAPPASPVPTSTALPAGPSPTPDRLAAPTVPANPSPAQLGASVYYTNCSPCHGDRGQGLTDEWRSAWVEDHQDCWEGGCHGGRPRDEGFPIPRTVPPAYGQGTLAAHFADEGQLFDYLRTTHPPQRPGVLTEDEYRQLTAFLLQEEGGALAP